MDAIKLPTSLRHARASLAAVAVRGLGLAGCSDAAAESKDASSKLEVEVCFTNELASKPVQVATTSDGSGTLWQTTLQSGQTGCSHSKNSTYDLEGFIQVQAVPDECVLGECLQPRGERIVRKS